MAQETTFDSNVGGSYQFFSSELWVSAYTAFYLQKKKLKVHLFKTCGLVLK